jgi:hypothetical protein
MTRQEERKTEGWKRVLENLNLREKLREREG